MFEEKIAYLQNLSYSLFKINDLDTLPDNPTYIFVVVYCKYYRGGNFY